MLRSRRNPDNAFYIEPRSGERYPLDVPRWCADGPKPLMINPQPGIAPRRDRSRHAIAVAISGLAAGRDCKTDFDGRRLHPAGAEGMGRFPAVLQAGMVQPDLQLQGSRHHRDAVLSAAARDRRRARRQFRQWRRVGCSLWRRGRHAREDIRAGLYLAGEGRPGSRLWRRGAARRGTARRVRSTRRYASPARCFTRATTGSRSSCREPSRSPTSCGKISVSPCPTTSSSRSAPAATCSAATSAFRNCWPPARSEKLPRLFAAQPLNCSPLDASFQAGVDTPVARAVHKTIAEGTAIAHPLRLKEMIHALKDSGGEIGRGHRGRNHRSAEAAGAARPVRGADLGQRRGGLRKTHRTGRHQGARKHGAC